MMKKNLLVAAVGLAIAAVALVACGGGSVTSSAPPAAVTPPVATPPGTTPPVAAAPFTVKVLGFNDYHGTMEAFGTLGESSAVLAADRSPVGGADFLAAHIARPKVQNNNNVVVAAGDNMAPRH